MTHARAADTPLPKSISAEELANGTAKLQEVLAAINDFSQEGFPYRDAARTKAELQLRECVKQVFGEHSQEFQSYRNYKLRTANKTETAQSIAAVEELLRNLEDKKLEVVKQTQPVLVPSATPTGSLNLSNTARMRLAQSAPRTTAPLPPPPPSEQLRTQPLKSPAPQMPADPRPASSPSSAPAGQSASQSRKPAQTPADMPTAAPTALKKPRATQAPKSAPQPAPPPATANSEASNPLTDIAAAQSAQALSEPAAPASPPVNPTPSAPVPHETVSAPVHSPSTDASRPSTSTERSAVQSAPAAPSLHQSSEQGPLQLIRKVCERLHAVARQLHLRTDSRSTIEINDDYDLQDLLRALLKMEFDEVGTDEWTPPYTGRTPKTALLLNRDQIAVVATTTRPGLSAKEIAEQVKADSAFYLARNKYTRLFCFIYDPEGRIGSPTRLEADLTSVSDRCSIEVLVAPK